MTTVSMSTALYVPITVAWNIIGNFNGLPAFVPVVIHSKTEGTGAGAVRTLTLRDGSQVKEKLEEISVGAPWKLSYSIVSSPLPVTDYHATMELSELGTNGCMLTWSGSFVPYMVKESVAYEVIQDIYHMGFEGLSKLFETYEADNT